MTDITYDDVFAALLSMDVYNRTIKQGVFINTVDPIADASGKQIGNATVIKFEEDRGKSFNAIAYEVGGTIFIDYRGTDDFDDRNMDPITGWLVGVSSGNTPSQNPILC
jgi:hypothetical protein